MNSVLQVSGLHARWNRSAVLRGYDARRGVSFTGMRGRWIAVIGDNGVGKSTLFHALAGTVPYVSGLVALNGSRLECQDGRARFLYGIQHVAQRPSLPPAQYLVDDAVWLATAWRPALRNDRAIDDLRSRLRDLCISNDKRCGADGFDLIAAIVSIPRVLLLDELRVRIRGDQTSDFYGALRGLVPGALVLFTDHDNEVALASADDVLWLRDDAAPVFGPVVQLRDEIMSLGPPGMGIGSDNEQPLGRALLVVQDDKSVREQVDLAVQCARRSHGQRRKLIRDLLDRWPFLDESRPAETLSGGERITLAWLLLECSGMGAEFPRQVQGHLSGERQREIAQVAKLLRGQ